MEWLESLEHSVEFLVHLCEFFLEFLSVLCVLIGLIKTVQLVIRIKLRHNVPQPFIEVRLSFGMWLSLALELQLGADVLATTTAPSFESLGKLAALALIRTFLNYFLHKELEEGQRFKQQNLNQNR